jgi:hypothetical protein
MMVSSLDWWTYSYRRYLKTESDFNYFWMPVLSVIEMAQVTHFLYPNICFILLKDLTVSKQVASMYTACCCCKKKQPPSKLSLWSSQQIMRLSETNQRLMNYCSNHNSEMIWFNIIDNDAKKDVIRTILSFITNIYSYRLLDEKNKMGTSTETPMIISKDYKIEDWMLTSDYQSEIYELDASFRKKFGKKSQGCIIPCDVVAHHPEKFSKFYNLVFNKNLEVFHKNFSAKNCEKFLENWTHTTEKPETDQ